MQFFEIVFYSYHLWKIIKSCKYNPRYTWDKEKKANTDINEDDFICSQHLAVNYPGLSLSEW